LAVVALMFVDPDRPGPTEPVRVGVIALTDVDNDTLAGFKTGMSEYGYVEGENIVYISEGPAGRVDRLEPLVRRTLEQDIDLIYVSSTPATLKVKELTAERPIPVIFSPVNDPVGAGIVPSLKQPGGMITGIKLPVGDTMRLRWLMDFAPQVRRIYFPYNPVDKSALESLRQIEEVAPVLQVELVKAPMATPDEILKGIAQAPDGIDAIFLPRDSSIESKIREFVELSYQRRIPLSAPSLTQVRQGALYTYGFVHFEFGKQSARLADQILMGVSPADIPVELAENYLAINLVAAEKIGLRFGEEVLRRADMIIREDRATR
jgi:putative ABC transport system substrate-binding protein